LINNTLSLLFRWLGAAGLEFSYNGFSLLIDPYLSRVSLPRVLFGKLQPDEKKIFCRINAANTILVTHSHFDHLMDVPVVAKKFNCPVYGSPNTCSLLERCGVPPSHIHTVAPGDEFSTGPFQVKVMKSSHSFVPLFQPIILPKTSEPPLHALDFGMDSQFSYRISTGSMACLTDPGNEVEKDVIDILFINTLQGARIVRRILKTLNPGVVIPIHWDNYFKPVPVSQKAPGWGLLPIRRIALKSLKKHVITLTPRGCFFLPKPFTSYRVEDILQHDHEYPSVFSLHGI
jgi:L-ascorbate metabolism protein UlaG (beta-lactamase superfamily)